MREKLYRSRRVRVFGGVAGGLAQYFNIDPIIVRVLFVVVTFFNGMGLLLYIILWIVVPEEPFEVAYQTKTEEQKKTEGQTVNDNTTNAWSAPLESKKNGSGRIVAGIILIALGLIFFADRFFLYFDFRDVIPVALVILGGLLILSSLKK
ncbi:MAG: PspC domain-containing protein [Bacteroidota bacterium]